MPLKRMSQYYLQLEEMNQYTPPSHNDKDHIKVALERVKLQLEQQKKMGTSSSIKRSGLRKIQTLESIVFDPKQGNVDLLAY